MEETPNRTGNSGMSGLKVVFFFSLLPEEDIIKVMVDLFLFKRGGEAGKKGFQPMRKKLGEKFGVVFSFAVVVMDTELFPTAEMSLSNFSICALMVAMCGASSFSVNRFKVVRVRLPRLFH